MVLMLVNNERMAVVPVVGVVNIQKPVMKYKHTYSLYLSIACACPLCVKSSHRLSLNSSIVSHTHQYPHSITYHIHTIHPASSSITQSVPPDSR
jgi:hypothetical protein